ncbi:methyltransferase family protein [Sphingomonas profundi]|uniref:methyltransferase family protein n=1 Tax=Alterirhizorhabdus profundi TaxID=2681549 RepID=UPI0018D1832E|nr:isoprenylcysteine carboxylmethyltransferase family protein [Sphingomonas profundi]
MGAGPLAFALWLVFLASWWGAALWTGAARSRATLRLSLGYILAFAAAFTLLFARPPLSGPPLWRDPALLAWPLLAAEIAAFAFAWWARVHLGRLWSGMMTLREGHRVVASGPYALVRHPIYTGFIAAAWALALLRATPAALAGAAVLTIVLLAKAGREEDLLRRELGAADYDAYSARVPMIVPFAPR